MDKVENVQKGCLYEEHNNLNISLICIDKKCQAISRTVCEQCMFKKIHDKCQQFISFDYNRENPNLKLEYSDYYRLRELYQQIYSQQQKMIQKIDQNFDELLEEVTEKINKLRKETKVKYLENMRYTKEVFKDFIEKQNMYQDYSYLNQVMVKYLENIIGIEELNKNLIEKQQQYNFTEFEEKDLQEQFMQLKLDGLFIDINRKDLQQAKNDILSRIDTYDLFEQKYQQIRKLEPIQGWEEVCDIKEDNIYSGLFTEQKIFSIYKSENSFKRGEKINFRFKVLSLANFEYFILGITAIQSAVQTPKKWFKNGNQIGIISNTDWKQEFIQKGGKSFQEIFREGQIISMDVCVIDNLMVIKDENSECIMESKTEFEQNIDDWVVVVGSNSNLQGYSIQVL